MFVARAPGGIHSSLQSRTGLVRAPGFGEQLALLKISGDIFGVRAQQLSEVLISRGGITGIGALHRQAVAGKGVRGL